MRINRVYFDGFKNLREVEVNLDQQCLTSVIIGQNGTGKSNLIEAIADTFRFTDLNRGEPRYTYEVDYQIGSVAVRLSNRSGRPVISADGNVITRTAFEKEKERYFPDLVFGYYSGGSRRLEKIFDSHQQRYYHTIKTNDDLEECQQAYIERRLFYCRPIHGVFALLALFAFPNQSVATLLSEKLGITGFHSALAQFKEPWFAKGSRSTKLAEAPNFWGAKGPAGACARAIRDIAFHPLRLEGNAIDDYRDKQEIEAQYACYIRNNDSLSSLRKAYEDDQAMFTALEAADISDLFRDLYVWLFRENNLTGDVSFADLSDGERQLLMVLGLIRTARGKRALFLLDEPDTHLNPLWQHTYLTLVREWTGIAGDSENCQIILTSHNPLTIAALRRDEVRVMTTTRSGKVSVKPPYTDPKGMGFTATLTEIFGLPTTLDPDTQAQIDYRNTLARIDNRTEDQEKQLIEINDELNRLGFMFEDREPLYQDFLRAMHDVRYAGREPLSPEEIESQRSVMNELLKGLLARQERVN